jgi:hypothetical protein
MPAGRLAPLLECRSGTLRSNGRIPRRPPPRDRRDRHGRCPFPPIRHNFGITSFGVNAWTGREAGDRIINEHDEAGEDEELCVVQSGSTWKDATRRRRTELVRRPKRIPRTPGCSTT